MTDPYDIILMPWITEKTLEARRVADEDSGLVSGDWFESLQDLDTMTLGIGGVAVLIILGVVMALRRSRSDDMEWDDDDEF